MNKRFAAFLCIALIIIGGCKEEPPYINYLVPLTTYDTTYVLAATAIPAAQPKEVLIEDISGASCKNCPEAGTIARALQNANVGRVNIVTNYPNISLAGLTDPIINKQGVTSKYDLRTDIGKTICTNSGLSAPPSLPTGYIDRKKFGTSYAVDRNNWAGYVNSQKADSTPVNIELEEEYDAGTKKLIVNVVLTYRRAIATENYLHIMLLQDSIVDAQESSDQSTGSTIYDSVYMHRHVLMDMLTAHTGDWLNSTPARSIVPGRVFKIRYEKVLGNRENTLTAPAPSPRLNVVQWDTKHVSILAFVVNGVATNDSKSIFQSKEIHIAH